MKNKLFPYFASVLMFGLLVSFGAQAQVELDDYKILYKFSTVKNADNTRLLEVSFTFRNKEDRKDILPLYDGEIIFINEGDSTDVKLGTARTDQEGTARLIMPADYAYLTDEEGFINLKAKFKKTDALPSKSKSLSIKDLFLELSCEEIDSVKTLVLHAFELDSSKTKVAVEELDVIFSVGGMISRMPIGEETLEDGEYEFEFPTDIPGDQDGNIIVFAKIDDHDDFGTVICSATNSWGVFDDQIVKNKNTLWSSVAPIWMYVVLSILLIGVWANYVYSAFNLYKISKEGKALAAKKE